MNEATNTGDDGLAPQRFEGQLEEIEAIVERLEAGDVELEEALALFERGTARLRQAARLLDRAEGRVDELIESASGDLSVASLEEPDARGSEDGEA
ncbi:MAG: exodeoxyribonuclease VII small subunit [Gemmatimonadota bacterium]|jgi:exodeoxyribonuclease VII small subunit